MDTGVTREERGDDDEEDEGVEAEYDAVLHADVSVMVTWLSHAIEFWNHYLSNTHFVLYE